MSRSKGKSKAKTTKKTSKKPAKKNARNAAKANTTKKVVLIVAVLVVLLAAAGFAYANNVRNNTPERIESADGAFYCYNKAGDIMTGRWIDFEGNRYYAGEDGKLYTGGIKEIGEASYYFGDDGVCFRDVFKVGDKVYSSDPEGKINMTEGWEDREGGKYYNTGNGECYASCIKDVEGESYAFDEDGILRTDTLFEQDGKQYFADIEGKILKNQPLEHLGKNYYAGADGAFVKNGYTPYGDGYFYINDDSAIAKEPVTLENGYTVTPDPQTGVVSKKEHDISLSEYIYKGLATYIKVDIDSQTMIFVKDGELLVSTDIVSGMYNKYDTPTGEYSIIYKARDVQLKGEIVLEGQYEEVPMTEAEKAELIKKTDPKDVPNLKFTKKEPKKEKWDVKVSYWLAFIGGNYGFHDASWRSYFGDYIYTWDGSHGCVNLPVWAAETLYNNADEGTPVFIY